MNIPKVVIHKHLEINLPEQEKFERFLFDLIQNDENNDNLHAYLHFNGKLLIHALISKH